MIQDEVLRLSDNRFLLRIAGARDGFFNRKQFDKIDFAVVPRRIAFCKLQQIDRNDVEDARWGFLPLRYIRIFDGIDFSDDVSGQTGFFLRFSLRRDFRGFTAFDEALWQSPSVSVAWFNQRHLRPSLGWSVDDTACGNLSPYHRVKILHYESRCESAGSTQKFRHDCPYDAPSAIPFFLQTNNSRIAKLNGPFIGIARQQQRCQSLEVRQVADDQNVVGINV